jgi:hypothetical protein
VHDIDGSPTKPLLGEPACGARLKRALDDHELPVTPVLPQGFTNALQGIAPEDAVPVPHQADSDENRLDVGQAVRRVADGPLGLAGQLVGQMLPDMFDNLCRSVVAHYLQAGPGQEA